MAIAIEKAGGVDALYERTGIQFLSFNTLPQIIADLADEPELVSRTASRLLIAEYFLYMMSGKQVLEATNASFSLPLGLAQSMIARLATTTIGTSIPTGCFP